MLCELIRDIGSIACQDLSFWDTFVTPQVKMQFQNMSPVDFLNFHEGVSKCRNIDSDNLLQKLCELTFISNFSAS